jgi:hypothetical protein
MLALPRLGRREGTTLVRDLAGEADALPAELVDEIIEWTDGVPLFVEEVTRALLETGSERRTAIASIPGASPAVPATLQASAGAAYQRAGELADRLDDDRARFAASWGLWITTGHTPNVRERHLGALVAVAERIGDPELTLQAHHSSWATWIWPRNLRQIAKRHGAMGARLRG